MGSNCISQLSISKNLGMTIKYRKTSPLPFAKNLILVLLLVSGGRLGAQVYCTSNATSNSDSNLENFVFNTISNNTVGACAMYSDFTNLSTQVLIGNTYTIEVTPGTCGSNYTKYSKTFIDWNQNGVFTDPGEEVFTTGPNVSPQTFSGFVTVPGTALVGPTRLRCVVEETGSLAGVNACGTYSWGETEDYTVVVAPIVANDLGITAITSPNSGCNLDSEQVSITVYNFGINSQSGWVVGYRVNNGPAVIEPMSGTLGSGQSLNYTFSTKAVLSPAGTYTIEAWSSLAPDTNSANDTSSILVYSIPEVSVYPYNENFENGNGGWLPGGTNSSWALGTPNKSTIVGAASGTQAYVTGGLGTSSYNSNEDSEILGPCFDFSSLQNPWISLSIWWHTENSWDGSNLQASTDSGNTWVTIGQAFDPGNWYNHASISSTPGGDGNGWSGGAFGSGTGSGAWVTAIHRLDDLAGQQSVRLRINFSSDGNFQYDGVAIDDIHISDGPVADLGADTFLCFGDTIFVDGGAGFSAYNWSTGGQSRFDTITHGMILTVQVTDSNGFSDIDTVSISFSDPQVNLGPDRAICPGDTLLLSADSAASYLWQDGSNTQTYPVVDSGQYHVTLTDSVGCIIADTISITMAIPPSLDLGADTSVCTGDAVVLDGGSGPDGTQYQWNTGSTSQILVVSAGGTYIASATSPGGCTAVDTILVVNFPSPVVNLGPDRVECGIYTLDAGGGATQYLWSNNMSTQTLTLSQGGTYSVSVTNQFGCIIEDTVNISIGVPPSVNLGGDQVLCNGQVTTLDAGNPGASYFWSTGDTNQTLNVTNPSLYFVSVTNSDGCSTVDSITVDASSLLVDLGPDYTICGNEGVVLDAGNPGNVFNWSTGESTQSILVSSPGNYIVSVTDPLGCSATDDINVAQIPGIVAGISAPTSASLGQPVQFTDVTTPFANSWIWNFGDGTPLVDQQNPSHSFAALGLYTITLISSNGSCRDTTTTVVNVNNIIGIEEELGASTFELYPNPSDGMFHLTFELYQKKEVAVEVLDLSGRVLLCEAKGRTQLFREDIDLGNFAKGLYILRIKAGKNTAYQKLVLQ